MKISATFLLATAIVGCALVVSGQTTNSGDITGAVTDTTGGALPGVTVTISDIDKNSTHSIMTNEAGAYDTGPIVTDHYLLTFTRDGFATYKRGPLTVSVGTTNVNVQMTVGRASQEIVVSSDAPLLETATSEVSLTIPSSTLTELPQVANPDWTGFTILQPGSSGTHGAYTVNSVGSGAANPGLQISVNGSLPFSTALLDGATTTSTMSDNVIMTPIFDAIAEVKMSDSLFSAQNGLGGVIYNQISKGGSDHYHGMVYDYFQNSALNAAPYGFGTKATVPSLHFNVIGGNFGGPVPLPNLRKRTFFFFAYERTINHSGGTNAFITVPSDAMRSGDFTGMNTIYDPTTQVVDPVTGAVTRQSFASEYGNGNKIPSMILDSVATNLQKYFPEATPGVGTDVNGVPNNNYFYRLPSNQPQEKYFGRFDSDVTSSNRLTGSAAWNAFWWPILTPVCPAGCYQADVMNTNDQISDVWSINHALINEFRLGYMQETDRWTPYSLNHGIPAAVGLQFAKADLFPGIAITNEYALTPGTNGFYKSIVFDPSDVVSLVLGRHVLHFGAELLIDRADSTALGNINPASMAFTGAYTASTQGTSNTTGSAYADFLLGYAGSWSAALSHEYGARMKVPQVFAQDDFKIKPALTLNLGLRWVGTTGWSEVHNNIRSFDPTVINPATNTLGAMWYASTHANGRTRLQQSQWNGFLPRVGFAYQFKEKTTIRGGYGIYSFPWAVGGGYGNGLGAAFSTSGSEADSTNGVNPVVLLNSDGNKNYQGAKGASINSLYVDSPSGADSYNKQAVSYTQYDTPIVRLQQWNLTLQRLLTHNTIAQVGYVGSHGSNLLFVTDLNAVPEAQLGPNDSSARPYSQFQSISGYYPDAISNYHALQAVITRRMGSGLEFSFNYTWSHFLDEQDSAGWSSQSGVSPFQDSYALSANYGPSNFDVRHMLKGHFIYQLPFGPGRTFLNNKTFVNEAVGGWEFSGIVIIQGGNPFTPTMATNTSYSLAAGGSQYPNVVGDPKAQGASGTVSHWFNVAAFAAPGAGQFGNMRRNSVYGPGISQFNASLHKVFPLWEHANFDLSASATNFFNHPSFQQPDSLIGPGHVGQIRSLTVGGRAIQLVGKIRF